VNPFAVEVPAWFVLCAGAVAYATHKALTYATHIWPWADRSSAGSDGTTDFQPVDPPELDDGPREGTRISKIKFTSRTQMRRPVRRYEIDEDGANPLRNP